MDVSSARAMGTGHDEVAELRRNGLAREADGGENHHGRGGAAGSDWVGDRVGLGWCRASRLEVSFGPLVNDG